ncbi:UBX domain-containing protein 1-like [Palaemon carinicauda]|uniref:UBX domain-containing protein 1-like n=1 Tax=Palaemon carinicauda TaxID=392227 RepID=UPI0035B67ACA
MEARQEERGAEQEEKEREEAREIARHARLMKAREIARREEKEREEKRHAREIKTKEIAKQELKERAHEEKEMEEAGNQFGNNSGNKFNSYNGSSTGTVPKQNAIVPAARNVNSSSFKYWERRTKMTLIEGLNSVSGTMTGLNYLGMLQEEFGDAEFYFQQDGAPPRYHRGVRGYLEENLQNRWIGRRGAVEFHARSSD